MRLFVWIAYHPKLLVREPTLNRSLIISKNSVEKAVDLQWNLDLTKCRGTGEIGSLYQGSAPYIL